jgi:lysophospholipase
MLQYNDTERNEMILNAYNGATQGNGTLDSEWPACVGCAILSRSFDRTGTEVPEVCTRCFERYCWDGTINSTAPANYVPELKIKGAGSTGKEGAAGRNSVSIFAALGTAIVGALVVL